jgi:hypothetical protein
MMGGAWPRVLALAFTRHSPPSEKVATIVKAQIQGEVGIKPEFALKRSPT